MNYYMLMNDYKSSLIPRYLHAIVDVKKQVNKNWDYEGSDYSFPYDMEQPDCPEKLFLLCNRNIGALKFNYYRHSRAHLMSDYFFDFLKPFRMSDFICKKLLATSIKDGETIRDDLNYIYFTNNDDFLDFDKSKLEEDRYRGVIPHKLVFSEKVLSYDIFAITGTLLSGHIFLSEMVAEKFFEKKIAGLKLIKSEDAFKEYCLDYGYDIEINKKRAKRRLP